MRMKFVRARRASTGGTTKPFDLQPLEARLLFAAPPPGSVITAANRQALLDGMTISSTLRNTLQAKLTANNVAGFDTDLLNYMRTRTNASFYFAPADAASYGTYITTNIGDGGIVARADDVKAHLFPQQSDATSFTVQLPADIDWDDTAPSSNPEFIHALNRHGFWTDLAQAFRFNGSSTYVAEMINQLSSWSQQFPTVGEPSTFSANDKKGWLLDTAIRVEAWSWAYFTVLASGAWSKEANSLFLYKLQQQGTYMATATPYPVEDNRSINLAKALTMVGTAFLELGTIGNWRTVGQTRLEKGIDGQFYNDGSHREQSPGYASGIIEDVLEVKHLYSENAITWPSAYDAKLNNALDAYYQFLSPNGTRPAIGDTYRNSSVTIFLKANLVQGVTTYPAAKPRGRDVWLFGPSTVDPHLGNPGNPPLGDRGTSRGLTDSGNYILRSGSAADARQIIFDAGPKGGGHGHFDLLNFELFGYGVPLIADPGLLRYDNSADRQWAVSTPAHNTISVDGASHGTLEGANHPGIRVDKWEVTPSYAQVTAHHFGYGYLSGRPVVARSIWYDFDGTMIVVDWAEAVESHEFATSFTIPGTSTSWDQAAGRIQSTNGGAGNVKIQTLLRSGQSAFRQTNRFTSSNPPPNEKDAATRYYVTQTGTYVVFAHVITAYDGVTPPDTSAQFLTQPDLGKTFKIRLFKNGVAQDMYFAPPALKRLNANATSRGSFSDLAYDSAGRLHLAYHDRDTKDLKYTVRGTNGKWSIVETIDNNFLVGFEPSMAIDGNGHVGIAYTNGNAGDLKYAFHNGKEWTVQTVDSRGSTGHYPSLAFSRNNGPVITYYDKSKGDLRMASSAASGFTLTTIDSGSIGTKDVGRFSHLVLDPTRPTASKWAIAYEDTGGGRYRYAIQGTILNGEQLASGYTIFNIDTTTTKLGGYTYLAFDSANRPSVSYYDSASTGLKFAASSGDTFTGINFTAGFVTTAGAVGYYSNLFYDSAGKANILYFDRTNGLARRARKTTSWTLSTLAPGGREIHVARGPSAIAYTNLNEAVPTLEVLFM
jgi:hypothetical protein